MKFHFIRFFPMKFAIFLPRFHQFLPEFHENIEKIDEYSETLIKSAIKNWKMPQKSGICEEFISSIHYFNPTPHVLAQGLTT